MIKYILVSLISVLGCFGQNTGQNVVNKVLLSRTTITSNQIYTNTAIQNIGQTNHYVVANIIASDAAQIVILIQGSADGISYANINLPCSYAILVASTKNYKCLGYGSYPYLRTSVSVNTIVSTVVTLEYIGTSVPVNTLVDTPGNSGMDISTLTMTNTTAPIASGGAGAATIYGVTLNIPSTATSFKLFCSSDLSTNNGTIINLTAPIAGVFIWPVSLRAYYQCPVGYAVVYTLGGTGGGSLLVNSRSENP